MASFAGVRSRCSVRLCRVTHLSMACSPVFAMFGSLVCSVAFSFTHTDRFRLRRFVRSQRCLQLHLVGEGQPPPSRWPSGRVGRRMAAGVRVHVHLCILYREAVLALPRESLVMSRCSGDRESKFTCTFLHKSRASPIIRVGTGDLSHSRTMAVQTLFGSPNFL